MEFKTQLINEKGMFCTMLSDDMPRGLQSIEVEGDVDNLRIGVIDLAATKGLPYWINLYGEKGALLPVRDGEFDGKRIMIEGETFDDYPVNCTLKFDSELWT